MQLTLERFNFTFCDKMAAELQQSIRGGPMKRRVKRHEVVQPLDTSYRLISLTQGQNAIVDTADFEWLNQWNWIAVWSEDSKTFYAARSTPSIKMHREILGCSSKEQGDHKNGNGLDNRRENLRKCSRSQNAKNRKMNRNNAYGFKGISFYKKIGKWGAHIRTNTKFIHLGCFPSAKEAAYAYDVAAKIHHGEFARLNFP